MAEENIEKKDEKTTEKKANKKASSNKVKKPGIFSRIASYFRECFVEIKKITWPTPRSVFKNMGIVIVVIAIIGLIVFALDRGLFALLGIIMNMGSST